jgi:MinD-like ATPase involved in chromosome partitioning or flagellar assembly
VKLIGVALESTWSKILSTIPSFSIIRSISNLSQLVESETLQDSSTPWDFILIAEIEDQDIPVWEWLQRLRARYSSASIVLFLKESVDPLYTILVKRLADAYQIHVAPQDITAEELRLYLEQLLGLVDQNRQEKIQSTLHSAEESTKSGPGSPYLKQTPLIVGWGTSPRVGVTTLITHAALTLARKSKLNIGVLDLNFKAPDIRDYVGLSHTVKDFLSIQSDLSSKMLVPQALRQSMVKQKDASNVSFLLASRRREYAGLVAKEEIDELLRVARLTFDVVFVDVNSYPDNAATLRALKCAAEIWMITEPFFTSFQSAWRDWYENVFSLYGLELEKFRLIVNKDQSGLYSPKAIASAMGVKLIGSFPNLDLSLKNNDLIGSTFMNPAPLDSPWQNSLNSIIEGFAERMGWEEMIHMNTPIGWRDQVKLKMKEFRGAL